jgi:hypothetical protein
MRMNVTKVSGIAMHQKVTNSAVIYDGDEAAHEHQDTPVLLGRPPRFDTIVLHGSLFKCNSYVYSTVLES